MRAKYGYTLMEILVVITLLSVLTAGLTALINPLEQIHRAQDSSVFVLMRSVRGAIAQSIIQDGGAPWSEDLGSVSLTSPSGKAVVDNLIHENQFQKDTYESNLEKFRAILISAPREGTMYQICYKPVAKGNYTNKDNRYDSAGTPMEGCPNKDCFTCFLTGNTMKTVPTVHSNIPTPTMSPVPSKTPTLSPQPSATPAPTVAPGCLNFDPEYPVYAWTCNYSTKWIKYGCTNYCVYDLGCGGGKCQPDERRLQKNYYFAAPSGGDAQIQMYGVETCQEHRGETTDEYCIKGREANCGYKNYGSDASFDYHWGCTNPRRPYEWVQYQ